MQMSTRSTGLHAGSASAAIFGFALQPAGRLGVFHDLRINPGSTCCEPLQPVQALTETGFTETGFKEQERSKSQPQSDLLGRMQASLFWVFARVKHLLVA